MHALLRAMVTLVLLAAISTGVLGTSPRTQVLRAPSMLYRSVTAVRATVRLAAAAKKEKGAAKGGFGKKVDLASGPTAKELLAQASKMYLALDSVQTTGDEQTPVTQWSITVRAVGEAAELSDWVPIALLALYMPAVSLPGEAVPGALAHARREILEAGGQVVPKLRTCPRDKIEYAFEPLTDFHNIVSTGLKARGNTRADAYKALSIEPGATPAEVKSAHRKLVMTLHPDRFVGDDAGAAAALEKMMAVTDAYEALGGGRGKASDGGAASWYEGLGGKARVSFVSMGALPKERAQTWLDAVDQHGYKLGVWPLDSELAMDFVARNVMRAA
ncbi:hypothetical protein T492DRAFT_1024670 [Pavlovales sp. CCMP2436]|nr:hypothetical protein T492DRAFT_1024670 [Pavlovales sp. CCMP2436]